MGGVLPKNVEVVEGTASSDDAYRVAGDGTRRIVRIRGTNTLRVHVTVAALATGVAITGAASASSDVLKPFAIVTIILSLMLAHLAPMVIARWVRRIRLDLSRREPLAVTGPIGRTVRVDAWAASRPLVSERTTRWSPIATFRWWDLAVENEAGGRTQIASFTDEASADAVAALLRDGYRDAPAPSKRSEIGARFGALPAPITLDGDVTRPSDATWKVTIRHPAGGWSTSLFRLVLSGTLTLSFLSATIRAVAAGSFDALPCFLPILVPLAVWCAACSRALVMRLFGRAHIEISPGRLVARAWPLPTEWLAPFGRTVVQPAAVSVQHDPRIGAHLIVQSETDRRAILPRFPLSDEDATYLARVLDAYYRARTPERPRQTS